MSNRGVVYTGPGNVEVRDIRFPDLVLREGPGVPQSNVGRKCEHGVILKIITTNICGSDQHMVRGRTTAEKGMILGHEITGEVIELGRDVEFIDRKSTRLNSSHVANSYAVICLRTQ